MVKTRILTPLTCVEVRYVCRNMTPLASCYHYTDTEPLRVRDLTSGLHSDYTAMGLARRQPPASVSSFTFSLHPLITLRFPESFLLFSLARHWQGSFHKGFLWSRSCSVHFLTLPLSGHTPKFRKSKITRALFHLLCLHLTVKHCSPGHISRFTTSALSSNGPPFLWISLKSSSGSLFP